MVSFISPTVWLCVSTTLVATVVHGQYFRPYPAMAMDHGFSHYHPARINHETLPISQAEFAQLVAESMATSNGPHHHHPPNTDQDYEGLAHAMQDRGGARSHHTHQSHHHGGGGGGGGGGHGHGGDGGEAHYHGENHHVHDDDHHQGGRGGGGGGGVSHYQPEDNYRSHQEADSEQEDNSYHRSPVYESSYHNDQDNDEANEDLDHRNTATYGGRPGGDGGHGGPQGGYDNYDHPHHLHHQQGGSHSHHNEDNGEESRLRPTQHYLPDEPQPAPIVKLVHLPF